MKQDKVNEYVDKTIGSLCVNGVDAQFIVDKLKDNIKRFSISLLDSQNSQMRTNYLNWYILFANKRIEDLNTTIAIADKMGIKRPDKIFRMLKFREKLLSRPQEKVV